MALEGWLNKIRYVFYYFEKDTPGTWEYTLNCRKILTPAVVKGI